MMTRMLKKLLHVMAAPFRWLERLLKRFGPFRALESGMPPKAKIAIAGLLLTSFAGAGYTAFHLYNFTQNDPSFCVSCHLMKRAYDAWSVSVHSMINCHDCHHLSIPEMNRLLISFVFHRYESLPPRHGKIIVPWEYCIKCHWQRDTKYASAPLINKSKIHAKHYFVEQIECSKCHGYKVHDFVPEERFCLQCHKGIEVHGSGMEEFACLNCHTDKTANLRPDRDKCLYCHGTADMRERLAKEERLDMRRFKPLKQSIDRAIKIDLTEKAPMQFFCYECHKPHAKVRPDWGNCLDCHKRIAEIGKHGLHITTMGMACKECHRPHIWTVTEEQAKATCTKCHEYRSPMTYLH